VDAGALEHVVSEVEAELDDAVEFARNSPDPTPKQALEDVYA
jgi:TPP-dependent pyruvate/acetoin dehydrogenase alpha subunit